MQADDVRLRVTAEDIEIVLAADCITPIDFGAERGSVPITRETDYPLLDFVSPERIAAIAARIYQKTWIYRSGG